MTITAANRPYVLTFHATGASYPLTAEDAQRLLDEYPAVRATANRVVLPGHNTADPAQRCTLRPATVGGGRAFVNQEDAMRQVGRLPGILAQGFDASEYGAIPGPGQRTPVRVRCSQCDARVINGVPAHEHGCPNQVFECKGCGNPVPRRGMYCEECR